MALSSKLANGQLLVLEGYPFETPKTREFVKVLNRFEINKALFVIPEEQDALTLSARNVPYVHVMRTEGLNVYDILRFDHLVLLKPAINKITERLAA
jgi:large subunit ribosomal protein L4